MKVVIFGATGKIGQHVMSQALEMGHNVSAFTRNPEQITQSHKNLRVIKGDVLNAKTVQDAVTGQDAVFCTLGMPPLNKAGLRAKGTKNIVRAMEETNVKRLICLSVYGAGDSWDLLPISYKYLIMPLLLRHVVKDHNNQENFITNSNLSWTIVRPVNFTKGERTGTYLHNFSAPDSKPTFKISQADVADFMTKQLSSDVFVTKAPGISY